MTGRENDWEGVEGDMEWRGVDVVPRPVLVSTPHKDRKFGIVYVRTAFYTHLPARG